MEDRTCLLDGCEAPAIRKGSSGRWPKWCDDHKKPHNRHLRNHQTRALSANRARWDRVEVQSIDRTCSVCLGGFAQTGKCLTPARIYCSRRCELDALNARRVARNADMPRRTIECAECGAWFAAGRSDARFCAKSCRSAWGRKHEHGECAQSGCERAVRAKGLCAKHYKAQSERKPEPWNDRRRDNYHRRRALKRATTSGAPVLRDEIAARDDFTCQLCTEPVDMAVKWPDPFSPSLDHVVPLSKGGVHDPSNVQLAHLRCNVAKGATTAA